MDYLDGVDLEAARTMTADMDSYLAALDCTCEGTCICDDSDALLAAQRQIA